MCVGGGTLSTCKKSLVAIITLFNIWSNLYAATAGGGWFPRSGAAGGRHGLGRAWNQRRGARAHSSGWLALWIIHGLRLLEINKMNDNKKLIKNFTNCFHVIVIGGGGGRRPLFPPPRNLVHIQGWALTGKALETRAARRSSDSGSYFGGSPVGLLLALQPLPSVGRWSPGRDSALAGGWVGGCRFKPQAELIGSELAARRRPALLRPTQGARLASGTPTHSGPSARGIPEP